MVPDLHIAEGEVVQLQLAVVEQLSDLFSLPQYGGQQTLSTKVHAPQDPGIAAGYDAWCERRLGWWLIEK
jgi:hypothetical protein